MLLALLAWVWVAGSALARGRSASERFAVGALAVCALAWTAMVAGALGVGLLGSTLATAGLALAAAAVCLALRPPLRAPRPAVAPLVIGCGAGLLLSAPQLELCWARCSPRAATCSGHLGWIRRSRAGPPPRAGSMRGRRTATRGCSMRWRPGSQGRCRVAPSAVWAMQGFGLACMRGTGIWLRVEIYDRRRAATWSVGLFWPRPRPGVGRRLSRPQVRHGDG